MTLFGMVTMKASAAYTPVALESFFAHTDFSRGSETKDRFVLIDNDGSLASGNEAKKIKVREVIEIDSPKKPRSFAENMNVLIAQALAAKQDLAFLNNDLVFTPHWFDGLLLDKNTISSPLSNREKQYNTAGLRLDRFLSLSQFQGHERTLEAIAKEHRRQNRTATRVLVLPFFAVLLPFEVLAKVGLLETSYGVGGGEDFDYCLRAALHNVKVAYCTPSYLLHFSGKSTWDGAERSAATDERVARYRTEFEKRWGKLLARMLIDEDQEFLQADPVLRQCIQWGDFTSLVEILSRDGGVPQIRAPLEISRPREACPS